MKKEDGPTDYVQAWVEISASLLRFVFWVAGCFVFSTSLSGAAAPAARNHHQTNIIFLSNFLEGWCVYREV